MAEMWANFSKVDLNIIVCILTNVQQLGDLRDELGTFTRVTDLDSNFNLILVNCDFPRILLKISRNWFVE